MDELLRDLVLVFVLAGAVLAVFHHLRLPALVGLLFAGGLIGPHGIGVLRDAGQIERMAELGILLLMFSIGLDFTPDRVHELVRAVGMGAAQMLFCVVVTLLLAVAFVGRWAEAVLLGFLVAHTSSTLMLKLFLDRGELSSPQVRLGLGISIAQDLSVVPMLLAVPMIAGGGSLADFALALLKVAGVLVVALGLARWVIPLWLHQVVRSRSRELFLIFLVVVSLGTAWATLAVGLSGALGAFLAGLAIAASAYSHQTLAEVVPFRDLLVSLFFISIGMLVDVRTAPQFAAPVVLLVLVVLALKFVSGFLPVLAWGYPLRIATLVGLGIAQVGEFSFVLAHAGREAGLMSGEWFQVFVLVAVLTMLVNPFLVAGGPRISLALAALPWAARFDGRGSAEEATPTPALEGHVVVAGYGLNGQTVVRALQALGVPHAALDLNPDTVQAAQQRGESVFYGDCTRAEVLRKLHLDAARAYVVAISDARATRQAVQVAHQEAPGLHILVRTRYLAEIDALHRLGAEEVIAEEFETSLEIVARVLHSFHLPRTRIEGIVQHFRGDAYEAFRGPSPLPNPDLLGRILPALQIEAVVIQEGAAADGRSLRELELRTRTGATLLAVQRDGRMETVPAPDFRLQVKDLVVLAGTSRQILTAVGLLERPEGRSLRDVVEPPPGVQEGDSRGPTDAGVGSDQ
ncbi:MAG: cation:proton antiporter [Planctomycetia bacterium]|nr:cation:proton antiporter [Planctomycetia bacterium]